MIYYVTEYPILINNKHIRHGNMSVKNKSDYIVASLNELGKNVLLLSTSCYVGEHLLSNSEKKSVNNYSKMLCFFCIGPEWGGLRYLKNRMVKLQLYLFMLLKLSREDTVIVYHDVAIAKAIMFIQKIKKFNLILEIEDIYHQVWPIKKRFVRAEKEILAKPYKSIVVSETMKKILDKKNAVVCYGAYRVYDGEIKRKIDRNKIIIVCTGSFDVSRGTGLLALDTIEKLPDNYVLYMSGKINDDIGEYISKRIQNINQKAGYEKCKFLGLLGEEEYEELLLTANIGLNTQKEGDYSSYIFPSKIIKYLSYNLDVVTTPGESIINSELSRCFHVTENFYPEDIAKCILDIDLGNHEDYRNALRQMHEEFKGELLNLIEE